MTTDTDTGPVDEFAELQRLATHLDHQRLNAEFARVPGDLAWATQQYADAVRAHLQAELEYKRARAKLAQATRRTFGAIGEKLTEAALVERLDADDDLAMLKHNEIDAEAEKLRARGVVQAIAAKGDMLVSLGAHVRAELENLDRKINSDPDDV